MKGRMRALSPWPWLAVVLAVPSLAVAEQWGRTYINSLPDSAFASVERDLHGKRERHLPHHDHTGALDLPHLLNALARHSQVKWLDPASATPALAHLKAHMQQVREDRLAHTRIRFPLDLNRATAEELAELPFIGPARAAAILEERERRRRFHFVEEVREVAGIGPIIFDAMRDLLTVGQD